jgi:sec-independent protein translocase protein TatB
MFDMGFTEMMLIGIVALIVIGPERLPGVARTAGKYFGRLKRFMTTVKADVEQELRADELRQILADQQQELDNIKDSMNVAGKAFEKEVNDVSAAGESMVENLDETSSNPEQIAASDKVKPKSTPKRKSKPKPKPVPKDQADDVKS